MKSNYNKNHAVNICLYSNCQRSIKYFLNQSTKWHDSRDTSDKFLSNFDISNK